MQEGSLVWIGIPATREVVELQNFYSSLFPEWKFHGHEGSLNGAPVHVAGYELPGGNGGGIVRMPTECPTQDQPDGVGMTNYYKVNDLDKTEAKVHELGGKTALGKTKEGENGWFMNFLDPLGNRFGVYQFNESAGHLY